MEILIPKLTLTLSFLYFNARLFTQRPVEKSFIDRVVQRLDMFNKMIKKSAQEMTNQAFRKFVDVVDTVLEDKPIVSLMPFFWLAAVAAFVLFAMLEFLASHLLTSASLVGWQSLVELISKLIFFGGFYAATIGLSMVLVRISVHLHPYKSVRYFYLWPFVFAFFCVCGYCWFFVLVGYLLVKSVLLFTNYVQQRPTFNFLDFLAGIIGLACIWL